MQNYQETLNRNITYAKKGLEANEFEYTVEICKSIILNISNCIDARKIMQIGLKELHQRKHPIIQIYSFIISHLFLLCALLLNNKWRKQCIEYSLIHYYKNKFALMWFGETALKTQDIDSLIFAYEELSAINPQKTDYAIALASTHFHLGQYKKVLEIVSSILEKNNNHTEALEWMEKAMLAQLETESTERHFSDFGN